MVPDLHKLHPDMAHNMTRDAPEDLQAKVDELERADRAKDQFLALLSHELRNHIHAIRTNAWLIKARAKDPELARPTEAIDRQVTRLSKLVEDLLDVIRVARKGEYEKTNLRPAAPSAERRSDWMLALAQETAAALAQGTGDIHSQMRERFDRVLLETALEHTGGHRQHAAEILGLGRNTLTRKLGTSRPRKKP